MTTNNRIKNASDLLAKPLNKIADTDRAMADRLTKVLAAEMEKIRRGE